MSAGNVYLRSLQRNHNLILLGADEFAALEKQAEFALPLRHRDHFGKVMRRSAEWPALVGDGSGRLLEARVGGGLISLAKSAAAIVYTPPVFQASLVQAWVKPKALAVILQKAAEIGAAEISLIDTAFSQAHSEKPQRLDAILENACMQAYNPVKPKLTLGKDLAESLSAKESTFFGDLEANLSLGSITSRSGKSAFINGPEGGFSPEETALLRERATGVLLSENVLRSESAAIIALGFLRLPR